MIEELHTASTLLCTALDRYVNACSALYGGCSYKDSINSAAELLDTVANEMDLIKSYWSKLARAQTAVGRGKNSLANVPINSLPAEVLTQIFHLVLAQQPCRFQEIDHWSSKDLDFPKYPDTFSHVCSQWRQIALSSHDLWSHIDIALSCPLSKGLHERATAYVARAHQLPLDIHIIDPGYIISPRVESYSTDGDGTEIESSEGEYGSYNPWKSWSEQMYGSNPAEFTFLAAPSRPQVRTLGLVVRHQYHPIHTKVLTHCIINCSPSGLSKLVLHVPRSSSIFPNDPDSRHQRNAPVARLSLSEQQLECFWLSITSLDLKGICPRRTGAAYPRLTNLHLRDISVSSLELSSFLRLSPGLQVLKCGIRITDLHLSGTPIALPELETLELGDMYHEPDYLLNLVNPGSKPLRLSFHSNPTRSVLQSFFQRSNVQELHILDGDMDIHGNMGFGLRRQLPRPDVLCFPSQLRVLLLSSCRWTQPPKKSREPTAVQLDTLHMRNCNFTDFRIFQKALAMFLPQRLVLCGCSIDSTRDPTRLLRLVESARGDPLPQFCSIECLPSWGSDSLQDWD